MPKYPISRPVGKLFHVHLDMPVPNVFYNPMDSDLLIKRKFTFRVGDQKLILIKKPVESARHVVMKALLWALYLPEYPDLQVETGIDHKYKPDLVHTESGAPVFWGEAGSIGTSKLRRIMKRFPNTHFAFAIWGADLNQFETRIRHQARKAKRTGPVDAIRFAPDADRLFIDDRGNITIKHTDLKWRRII